MTQTRLTAAASALTVFFALPWAGFVAAFLFYVGLTLVAIGMTEPPDTALTIAYLLPVVAYAALLLARALRALAAVPVQIGHLALPRLQ